VRSVLSEFVDEFKRTRIAIEVNLAQPASSGGKHVDEIARAETMSTQHTCLLRHPDRRRLLAAVGGVAISFARPSLRIATAAPASPDDERFMRMAIDEARHADFPFGAVIVRDAEVIARGANMGRRLDDPTAHGEMQAIRHGLAEHGSAALRGATLYTSGEPCAMCMGAIIWCRFGRLVYAASVDQLATKINQIMVPCAEIAAKSPFAPISITGGVLAAEAMSLFGK
jgi:tRNA(adenine34) deaminase